MPNARSAARPVSAAWVLCGRGSFRIAGFGSNGGRPKHRRERSFTRIVAAGRQAAPPVMPQAPRAAMPDRRVDGDRSRPAIWLDFALMRHDASLAEIAQHLLAAHASGRTIPAISASRPMSLDDAYGVQALVSSARLARGERIAGWKLGYTSLAMRQQMGIDAPNFGPLTDAMLLPSGAFASASLIQPRVEPEIAVVLGSPLEGAVGVEQVAAAVAHAVGCLEVVDSVFADYRFTLEDNTADGSSAAQVVLGARLPATADALAQVEVNLRHNGEVVGAATGAAASGDPLAGVAWLVGQLARSGRRLEAGDVVITGGLCRAVPLAPGDRVSARFSGGIEVSVARRG